jgi:transcriptional regulator with XRE-family HTH domain
MIGQPTPPAEADLIRQRRESVTPAMSRRQAAMKAGISPSQWSDVERGHKRAGSGITIPVQATAETLARMARVVGASGPELAAVGREDASHQLRAIEQERELRRRITAIPGLGTLGSHPLTGADGKELLPLIAEGLDAIEHSGLPHAAKRELTGMFVDNLINDAARRHSELQLILRLVAASGTSSEPNPV